MKKVCPDPPHPVEKILNFFFRMNPSLREVKTLPFTLPIDNYLQVCPSIDQHQPECSLMSHARDMLILNSDKDVQQVGYNLITDTDIMLVARFTIS